MHSSVPAYLYSEMQLYAEAINFAGLQGGQEETVSFIADCWRESMRTAAIQGQGDPVTQVTKTPSAIQGKASPLKD